MFILIVNNSLLAINIIVVFTFSLKNTVLKIVIYKKIYVEILYDKMRFLVDMSFVHVGSQ